MSDQQSVSSLDRVFSESYQMLVYWCRKRVDPRVADPEDFVHLAYLRCRKSWKENRQSARDPKSFLYKAVRWAVLDELRCFARRRNRLLPLERDATGHDLASPIRQLMAREVLDRLPRRQREVCQTVLCGKSLDEVAEKLAISRQAVATYLCRARVGMRSALE